MRVMMKKMAQKIPQIQERKVARRKRRIRWVELLSKKIHQAMLMMIMNLKGSMVQTIVPNKDNIK